MDLERVTNTYSGKVAKRALRYEAWEERMEPADHNRFGALFNQLQ